MKRGYLAWAAVVVPTWLVLIACTHWEPVLRDGWGHLEWHKQNAVTLASVWESARDGYLNNNPRLGQLATLLLYTPGPWHVIVTPLVELGVFWLLAVLALGRRPELARTDDALVFATITALVGLCAPQIGPMLFYRPFTGNYVYGFALGLVALVPYRLHAEAPRAWPRWFAAVTFAAGAVAGMCNEHVTPALVVVVAAAIVGFVRRGERPAAWMVAGLTGLIAGGAALLFAPGQAVRYNGLGAQSSMLDRIVERSVWGNAHIVLALIFACWKLVPWLAAAVAGKLRGGAEPVSRARAWSAVAGIGGALAIALTLLVSPKQGQRLYFAPVGLMCAAVASVVVPLAARRGLRIALWLGAAASLAYTWGMCVATYRVVGAEYAERISIIDGTPAHGVATVEPYTKKRSRWFLGEDFGEGADHLRFGVAWDRHLAGVLLARPAEAAVEEQGGL